MYEKYYEDVEGVDEVYTYIEDDIRFINVFTSNMKYSTELMDECIDIEKKIQRNLDEDDPLLVHFGYIPYKFLGLTEGQLTEENMSELAEMYHETAHI